MLPSNQNTAPPPKGDLLVPNPKLRLREQLHEVMRFKHYSVRTEEAYWNWIRQFLEFCRERPRLIPALSPPSVGAEKVRMWRHPKELGMPEVQAFLAPIEVRQVHTDHIDAFGLENRFELTNPFGVRAVAASNHQGRFIQPECVATLERAWSFNLAQNRNLEVFVCFGMKRVFG